MRGGHTHHPRGELVEPRFGVRSPSFDRLRTKSRTFDLSSRGLSRDPSTIPSLQSNPTLRRTEHEARWIPGIKPGMTIRTYPRRLRLRYAVAMHNEPLTAPPFSSAALYIFGHLLRRGGSMRIAPLL